MNTIENEGVWSVKLHNIPEHLDPGAPIACTANDVPFEATFLRYGQREDGTEWRRIIWAKIDGLREVSIGKLTAMIQLDMFAEPPSFTDEFVVNADGTACNGYWQ